MIKLKRILKSVKKHTDDWTEYTIKTKNEEFSLTEEEFNFLLELQETNQYDYELSPSFILNLDHSPRKLEEKIKNKEFIKDYEENINKKFFINYYIMRPDNYFNK